MLEIAPYKMVVLDALSHAVLLIDGPRGEILAEFPLPDGHTPVDLAVKPDTQSIYISLTGPKNSGALLLLDPQTLNLNLVTTALPYPARLALRPGGEEIYLTDQDGILYAYWPAATKLTAWGKPAGSAACAGLAGCDEIVCGVWETLSGGILAAYDSDGKILFQHTLGGIPTGLSLDRKNRLFVPFTASAFSGEGVFILSLPDQKSAVVNLQCPCCAFTKAYPLHVAIEPTGQLAYVACEDNATIAIIDITRASLCGSIPLGHSISRLALLPDGQLAVASSNMFADLCLVDLINKRPLSFTDTRRELLSPLAIIN